MAKNKTQHSLRTLDIDTKIVSNIDNGIIVLDDELHIHYCNKWMRIHTNLKEENTFGKKIDTVFPNIKTKTLTRKIKTALKIKTPTFYSASTSGYLIPIKLNQIKSSKFQYMQQDVSIIPIDYENNLVSLIITDQTDISNTNAKLQENILKVKELNAQLIKEKELSELQHQRLLSSSRSAAMGEMISMIAHQWRQPLTLINTLISSIKLKNEMGVLDKTTMEESFGKIENTVKFLSDTINDFKDYFKPNKTKTEVNLDELFNKSIFFLKDEMLQLDIKYVQNIDATISITTYKNELIQSIINIFKNSIDAFKEHNTQHKVIAVSVENKNNTININIEDNAGGIEAEILNKVFDPYFSTKNKNGTGLGLYMCKTIITEHLGGDISINSSLNGTKVAIKLPKAI